MIFRQLTGVEVVRVQARANGVIECGPGKTEGLSPARSFAVPCFGGPRCIGECQVSFQRTVEYYKGH